MVIRSDDILVPVFAFLYVAFVVWCVLLLSGCSSSRMTAPVIGCVEDVTLRTGNTPYVISMCTDRVACGVYVSAAGMHEEEVCVNRTG